MSKRSAHVNNKVDLIIILDGVEVEHITVHPNMFQVPRTGDLYKLTSVVRNFCQTEADGSSMKYRNRVTIDVNTTVYDIRYDNAIIRSYRGDSWSTELLQTITLFLKTVKEV